MFLFTLHYIELPHKLRNSKKGLTDIKSIKNTSRRITKANRRMISGFNCIDIEFPVSKKDYSKIEKKNSICINVFYVPDEKFEDCMDLLLITDENKWHYVCITEFNRFMCNKTKNKNKKHFCRYCLQCFISEKVLMEQKKVCLKINGKRNVKLKSESVKFN